MSTPEMGHSNPEYQFGQETIVKVTAEKLAALENSNMPLSQKVDEFESLHGSWDQILEELEKAKGN